MNAGLKPAFTVSTTDYSENRDWKMKKLKTIAVVIFLAVMPLSAQDIIEPQNTVEIKTEKQEAIKKTDIQDEKSTGTESDTPAISSGDDDKKAPAPRIADKPEKKTKTGPDTPAEDNQSLEKTAEIKIPDKPSETDYRPAAKTKPVKKNNDINMEAITIKGKKRIKTNLEKAGTTTSIGAEDIEVRNEKLLKDTLKQIPGMQVQTQKKGTRKFSMRGYDMSKVAILIDGIPVIDAFGGGMDIDNIGLMDISQIIISRGTSSALYGTRGVVGSINLIKNEPEEMYTNISAEIDHNLNHVLSASHGAPIGDFYYYVSGSYDRSRGYTISKKLDRETREKWLLKISRYDLYGFTLQNIYDNPASCAATYYLNDTALWDHTSHTKYKINGKIGYHFTPTLEAGITSFYNNSEMKKSNYFTDMRSMYTYNDYTGEKDWRLPDSTYILRNLSTLWPVYDDYAIAPYVVFEKDKLRLKANGYFYGQYNKFLAYDDPEQNVLAYNRDEITMTWSIWNNKSYGFNVFPSYDITPWNTLNCAISYYISDHLEEEQAYNDESTKIIKYYGHKKYKIRYIKAGYLTVAAEDEMHLKKNIDLTFGISYDAQDLMEHRKKINIYGNTTMVDQYQAMDDSILWGTRDSLNPVAGIIYEPVMNLLKVKASLSRKTSFPTLRAYTKTVSPYQESSDLGSADVKIKPEKPSTVTWDSNSPSWTAG